MRVFGELVCRYLDEPMTKKFIKKDGEWND